MVSYTLQVSQVTPDFSLLVIIAFAKITHHSKILQYNDKLLERPELKHANVFTSRQPIRRHTPKVGLTQANL